MRRRELAAAVGALAVLSLAVYAGHVLRGGWYYDDWSFIARLDLAADDGIGSAWEAADKAYYRPMYSVAVFVMYLLGGTGQAPYLVLGVALAATQGALLYALLRRLRVAWPLAAAAAAMLVVLPVVDATRLWAATFPSGMAVAAWLAGVHVALAGTRARSRVRAVAWHVAALALYAAAMLTSELTIPLVALSPLLYGLYRGPRPALLRLPADLAAAGAALVYLAGAAAERRPTEGSLSHFTDRAGQIWRAGVPVVEQQIPLDALLWGPLGLVVLALAAAGIAFSLARRRSVPEIRSELLLTAIGAGFTLAGLVMLLPAESYYVPRLSGVGDRVSIAAAPGFVCFLSGLLALVARGLAAPLRTPVAALAIFAVAAVATVGSMIQKELRVQRTWAESWKQSQAVVGAVKRALGPELPRGSAIVTFRHTTWLLPQDVPVFAADWDLRGAMRLTYRDPTMTAHPYMDGQVACAPAGIELAGRSVPYGDVYFVDAAAYAGRRIPDRRACQEGFAAYGA